MSQLLQTLLLWPLFWVALGIAFSRFFASRAMMASGVGLLVGVLVTVRVVGTPSPETYLSAILAWPLLGAAVILFMPRQWTETIRRLSVLWLWAGFVLSLWLLGPVVHASLVEVGLSGALRRLLESAFFGDYALAAGYDGAGYRFVEHRPWIPDFGITYKVGVDGISLWLLILTTLLSPLSLIASWNSIDNKVKEYAFSFLLLTVGMLGAFLSLDLFLFYVFWELMLVPMYLIIGIWGGKDRVYAAVKFFLYTMIGSLLMLVALLYLVMQFRAQALADGATAEVAMTFDLEVLSTIVLSRIEQVLLFCAFGLAFAIKVPMFPFHTWLPDAHVQAPTGGSVILAAVLLKLGGYGFLRFAIPLFPWAFQLLGPTIALFAVIGIIYGAYCAWVQQDVKKLVAYSSVSHLGFVMLGILSRTEGGIAGAILQMVSHGISTGALFILVGVIYDRRHTRDLSEFGGLAKVMPLYATAFVIVTMSSIGLPGTNGFVGEFMILSSTFVSELFGAYAKTFAFFAATGVILAAIYMLHAVLKMFWGPVDVAENEDLPDLSVREQWVLAPLILLVFWIGLVPSFFLGPMEGAVERLIGETSQEANLAARRDQTMILWPGGSPPAAEGAEEAAPEEAPDADEGEAEEAALLAPPDRALAALAAEGDEG